jgi:hypothetical protein
MFGASLAAIHAFSLLADDMHYFRLNVISVYHGWSDKDAIHEEIRSMDDASKENEDVSDAGMVSMLQYLIDGKAEDNSFDLAEQMGY